jgi:hypothetical protein
VKGWKKIYQANGSQKQAGVSILISDIQISDQDCSEEAIKVTTYFQKGEQSIKRK